MAVASAPGTAQWMHVDRSRRESRGRTKDDLVFTDPPYGMSHGGGRAAPHPRGTGQSQPAGGPILRLAASEPGGMADATVPLEGARRSTRRLLRRQLLLAVGLVACLHPVWRRLLLQPV